jgi:hypothetical protein
MQISFSKVESIRAVQKIRERLIAVVADDSINSRYSIRKKISKRDIPSNSGSDHGNNSTIDVIDYLMDWMPDKRMRMVSLRTFTYAVKCVMLLLTHGNTCRGIGTNSCPNGIMFQGNRRSHDSFIVRNGGRIPVNDSV